MDTRPPKLMDFHVAGVHFERRPVVILIKKKDGAIEGRDIDIN